LTDVFSKEKRSEIMSRIKSKDTKIEVRARHWLFNHGIRYRKNCKDIQGKPDIAIKKYKIAVFFMGAFGTLMKIANISTFLNLMLNIGRKNSKRIKIEIKKIYRLWKVKVGKYLLFGNAN
jgi:DNA mismatch endonuclease Vsr